MLYNYVVQWKPHQYYFLASHSSNKHCQTICCWQVRASSYNSNKLTNQMQQPCLISNLMHKNSYLFTYNTFIKILYMF
jgi:hypothetical protein